MNPIENRFFRLKRFSIEQIEALHKVERDAALTWDQHYPDGRYVEAGSGWVVEGSRFMDATDRQIGKLWDDGKLEADRARELDLFVNDKIVRKAFAQMDLAERSLPALHLADWEVYRKAYCPNTSKSSSENRERLNQIYSRAAKPVGPYAD